MIDMIRSDLMEDVEQLGSEGYRVLAVAYREYPTEKKVFSVSDESDLILLGYIAFYDPPKDSAAQAIAGLKKAGVTVKILTGDNPLVTRKVCADVGLDASRIITGDQIAGLNNKDIGDLAESVNIFAKLSPAQKESIITALRDRGHVVGYMGDGINDAPSLKTADVGISVDTGVDVAKEAADIVLLEKSLTVLEDGIMEGRRVFCNIVKYVRMGASSNFGNMFSVVGAAYFLPFLPMAPIQILVNNLLYDFSQLGIPTDTVDEELLEKPRRWNIGNIKRFMIFIGPMSSIFDYATYALMLWGFACWNYKFSGTSDSMKVYYEHTFNRELEHQLKIDFDYQHDLEKSHDNWTNDYTVPAYPQGQDHTDANNLDQGINFSLNYSRPLWKNASLETGYEANISLTDQKQDVCDDFRR